MFKYSLMATAALATVLTSISDGPTFDIDYEFKDNEKTIKLTVKSVPKDGMLLVAFGKPANDTLTDGI